MQTIDIYVSQVTDKNGKKFTAYETTDKDKNRVSVRFVQGGDKPPENPCRIKLINAWVDKRKRYPILRVKEFEKVADIEKQDDNAIAELFGDKAD